MKRLRDPDGAYLMTQTQPHEAETFLRGELVIGTRTRISVKHGGKGRVSKQGDQCIPLKDFTHCFLCAKSHNKGQRETNRNALFLSVTLLFNPGFRYTAQNLRQKHRSPWSWSVQSRLCCSSKIQYHDRRSEESVSSCVWIFSFHQVLKLRWSCWRRTFTLPTNVWSTQNGQRCRSKETMGNLRRLNDDIKVPQSLFTCVGVSQVHVPFFSRWGDLFLLRNYGQSTFAVNNTPL